MSKFSNFVLNSELININQPTMMMAVMFSWESSPSSPVTWLWFFQSRAWSVGDSMMRCTPQSTCIEGMRIYECNVLQCTYMVYTALKNTIAVWFEFSFYLFALFSVLSGKTFRLISGLSRYLLIRLFHPLDPSFNN